MMKCSCGGTLRSANTFSGKKIVDEKRKYIKTVSLRGISSDNLIIRSRKCDKCGVYHMTVEILDRPFEVRQNMRDTLQKKARG